jgi:hypothetical protein
MSGLSLGAEARNLAGVITGLNYLNDTDLLGQVMTSIDQPVRNAFETAYGNTPFIHATGKYHDAVRFTIGKDYYRILASIPYSSFIEYPRQSFRGYYIMNRMKEQIERELDSNLSSIISNILREV